MVLHFEQKSLQPNPVYEGTVNGKVVISGMGATSRGDAFVTDGHVRVSMDNQWTNQLINGHTVRQVTNLYTDQGIIGCMYPEMVVTGQVLFINTGYVFFGVYFCGEFYTVYEVSVVKNQLHYCVYKGNELIAIIQKNKQNEFCCHSYIIYAMVEQYAMMLCAISYLLENVYEQEHDIDKDIPNEEFVPEMRMEIASKFDRSFIERCL